MTFVSSSSKALDAPAVVAVPVVTYSGASGDYNVNVARQLQGPIRLKFPVFPGDIIVVDVDKVLRLAVLIVSSNISMYENVGSSPRQTSLVVTVERIVNCEIWPDTFEVVTVARVEEK